MMRGQAPMRDNSLALMNLLSNHQTQTVIAITKSPQNTHKSALCVCTSLYILFILICSATCNKASEFASEKVVLSNKIQESRLIPFCKDTKLYPQKMSCKRDFSPPTPDTVCARNYVRLAVRRFWRTANLPHEFKNVVYDLA